jgi:MoaA/NifB/PqqE/SkfB family radical SAM enzyme
VILDQAHSVVSRYLASARYVWFPRKPLALARIGADLARVAAGQRPLRYVDLALDYRCNLRCEHCSAEGLRRDGVPVLRPAQWRQVVDQATELGAFLFGLTGGEPLVLDLESLVRELGPERMLVYVVTNGTLLSRERARSLHAAGVDIVGISLDSADPEAHDRVRGAEGAQARAWEAVRNALAAGLAVVVATTVTRRTVQSPGLERLLRQTEKLRLLTVLGLACPTGGWAGREELMLRPEDTAHLSRLMARYRHTRRDFQSNWVEVGCGAAKEKLYVSPYGEVMPCPFFQVGFGNVAEEPLADIRRRMIEQPELAGYPRSCLVGEDPGFLDRFRARMRPLGCVKQSTQSIPSTASTRFRGPHS